MSNRNTAQRDRDRARIRATKAACHICGEAIDYSLAWPDPMCFVVDHKQAIVNGGVDRIENKAASHNRCNSLKRAKAYAPIVRRSNSLA